MPDQQIEISNNQTDSSKKGEITSKKIMEDLLRAYRKKQKWIKAATKDFEMFLGKQWNDEDIRRLEEIGVKALTINKIQANIFLLSGIQRQNRSDFVAFPEGEEDGISAEIATKLLKNLMKQTMGEHRLSEEFEDGIICGEGWLEPHIDYTYDLVHGEMKLKKISAFCIFADPKSEEYDGSDGRYMIKIKKDLSRDQLDELFPDKFKELDMIGNGKVDLENSLGSDVKVDGEGDYETAEKNLLENEGFEEKTYDLIEYYYKKPVKKFVVIDLESGNIEEFKNKKEANEAINAIEDQLNQSGLSMDQVRLVERMIPEIWIARMIGNKHVMSDEISWTYPRWRGFPFIPFKAHWINVDIKDTDLLTQGYVRSGIDLQIELNKRRTQELRHLNQSANSGWLIAEDSWSDRKLVEDFGSTPGITLEYDPNLPKPERINPTPLSQGHAQLAAENTQDMKEVFGINSDLLSTSESSQSGRAIRLRQQQGFTMIQKVLDNFSLTKKILGRFLLSTLGEVYTIEKTKKVLGEAFIQQNFTVENVVDNHMDEESGQMVNDVEKSIDEEALESTIAQVLDDTQFGKFDVNVGEGENSETTRISNFLMLKDLAELNIPIPPGIIIEESLLSSGSKEKIKASIEIAQNVQQGQVQ